MSRDRTATVVHAWRLLFLALAMAALFGALVVRLWNLQVAQGMPRKRSITLPDAKIVQKIRALIAG